MPFIAKDNFIRQFSPVPESCCLGFHFFDRFIQLLLYLVIKLKTIAFKQWLELGKPVFIPQCKKYTWIPLYPEALIDFCVRKANLFCKFSKRHFSKDRINDQRVPSISVVLFTRNPSTILWAVWSVVVNAIQLKAWLVNRAHICNKRFKPIFSIIPTVAYLYSSAAIVLIPFILGIGYNIEKKQPVQKFPTLSLIKNDAHSKKIRH